MIESWLVGWGKTHSQSVRVRARHFVHQVRALTDGLLCSLLRSSIARSIARDAIHRRERINVVTTAAACSLGSVWLPLRSVVQAGGRAHTYTPYSPVASESAEETRQVVSSVRWVLARVEEETTTWMDMVSCDGRSMEGGRTGVRAIEPSSE